MIWLDPQEKDRVARPLARALEDSDPSERAAAATALGWVQEPSAVIMESLLATTRDEDPRVAWSAMLALAGFEEFGSLAVTSTRIAGGSR